MLPHTGFAPVHAAHAPPLLPHRVAVSPTTHAFPLQQSPEPQLPHCRVPPQPSEREPHRAPQAMGVQPHTPAVPPPPHVFGAVQSELDPQPHVWPDSHTWPAVDVVQSTHSPPLGPHAPGLVPVWHIAPSQQVPLHACAAVQDVAHVEPVHAFPGAQSPAVAQPHEPLAWHTCPVPDIAQSTHAAPVFPQNEPPAAPVWQRPPVVSQHPVLHSSVTPPLMQVFVHECVERLHAWFAGQSVDELHPHCPAAH
jgi:hypothetical protein